MTDPQQQQQQHPLRVNSVVNVDARVWRGIHKPGGIGKITAVHLPSTENGDEDEGGDDETSPKQTKKSSKGKTKEITYDITYVLGGKERNVESRYVSLTNVKSSEEKELRATRSKGIDENLVVKNAPLPDELEAEEVVVVTKGRSSASEKLDYGVVRIVADVNRDLSSFLDVPASSSSSSSSSSETPSHAIPAAIGNGTKDTDVELNFYPFRDMTNELVDDLLHLTRDNMMRLYDESGSGWKWSDEVKMGEFYDVRMRWLLLTMKRATTEEEEEEEPPSKRPRTMSATNNHHEGVMEEGSFLGPKSGLRILGFVAFRLAFEMKVPHLYIHEFQIAQKRKGWGHYLMESLVRIGRGTGMQILLLTHLRKNAGAKAFYESEGFTIDEASPGACYNVDNSAYEILSKVLDEAVLKYACSRCGYKCRYSDSLQQHGGYLHGDPWPCPCPKCPRGTVHEHQLRRHIEMTHPEASAGAFIEAPPDTSMLGINDERPKSAVEDEDDEDDNEDDGGGENQGGSLMMMTTATEKGENATDVPATSSSSSSTSTTTSTSNSPRRNAHIHPKQEFLHRRVTLKSDGRRGVVIKKGGAGYLTLKMDGPGREHKRVKREALEEYVEGPKMMKKVVDPDWEFAMKLAREEGFLRTSERRRR